MFGYSGIIPYILPTLLAEIICDCKPSTCKTSIGHIDINQGTSKNCKAFCHPRTLAQLLMIAVRPMRSSSSLLQSKTSKNCRLWTHLVHGGWTNPFEKYARPIGSFPPNIRGEHKSMWNHHLDVSENSGTPKSSILIGFSIINHQKIKGG